MSALLVSWQKSARRDWAVVAIVLGAVADWYLPGGTFAGPRASANAGDASGPLLCGPRARRLWTLGATDLVAPGCDGHLAHSRFSTSSARVFVSHSDFHFCAVASTSKEVRLVDLGLRLAVHVRSYALRRRPRSVEHVSDIGRLTPRAPGRASESRPRPDASMARCGPRYKPWRFIWPTFGSFTRPNRSQQCLRRSKRVSVLFQY